MQLYGFGSGIPIASVAKLNYMMSIHDGYCNQKVSSKCLFSSIIGALSEKKLFNANKYPQRIKEVLL